LSLNKLNVYAVGNVLIDSLMNTVNKLSKGFHQCSLTEWGTTGCPLIAAGSVVGLDGAVFEALADESVGGTAADGVNYIKMIPTGEIAVAEWTQNPPVWSISKQGWYSSEIGHENERYLNFFITKASALYYKNYFNNYQIIQAFAHGFVIFYSSGLNKVYGRYTEEFYIKKPCVFRIEGNDQNLWSSNQYKWVNGEYVRSDPFASPPIPNHFKSINGDTFILPGRYKIELTFSNNSAANYYQFNCYYVEGLPLLADAIRGDIYEFIARSFVPANW